MREHDSIVRIFSGSEVEAFMIKSMLDEAGITATVRNDFQAGVAAGFVGGLPGLVDLYVSEADQELALKILAEIEPGNR